jgi:catechol 2,3-dioxygenase-like lactoylglutathione lyase family enzyme
MPPLNRLWWEARSVAPRSRRSPWVPGSKRRQVNEGPPIGGGRRRSIPFISCAVDALPLHRVDSWTGGSGQHRPDGTAAWVYGGFAWCLRSTEDLEQRVNFQGVVINVADLERSIDFYREVLNFTLLSQKEQLAGLSAPGSDRTQVVVLRAFGSGPIGGARHIGLRVFILEVESADQLEQIASELESRKRLVGRRDHSEWTAVVGHDPDEVAVVVSHHPGGERFTEDGWRTLDDFLYGIGE